MNFLRDLPVLILGLGDSGLAMARWCMAHGAQVSVWDSREQPPQAKALRAEMPGVPIHSGALGVERLAGCRLVLKSPGLAPGDVNVAALLNEAKATGVAVLGELDLFVRALADLKADTGYAPQIVAVTGTNGKTTTTAMTALLLQYAGRRVASAGNIGPTLLDTLAAALKAEAEAEAHAAAAAGADVAIADVAAAGDIAPEAGEAVAVQVAAEVAVAAAPDSTLPQVWVLELSSFQLEGGGQGVREFEPDAAVVLNISQDHLDWHGSLDAYVEAKARVFGSQGWRVINRDDARVEALAPVAAAAEAPAKKGRAKAEPRAPLAPVLRFGLDAPRHPGDFGLVVENGMAWLVRALPAEDTGKRRKDADAEIHLQRLMPADALRVRGRHNAANALAALALATAIKAPLAPMLHALREYRGEPHRVQWVATVDEVEAFDDSKGTNVGATVAALEGLGADKAPGRLVVILGGDGKGQDFAPLLEPLRRHARAVALLGKDAAAIETALTGLGGTLQRHATLEAAVRWCFEQAQPGDAVLLSPACASLDMFRNYAHRAEVFVQAVTARALQAGQA